MLQKLFYSLIFILGLYVLFILFYLSFESKFIYPGPKPEPYKNQETQQLKKSNLEFIEQKFFKFKNYQVEFFQREKFFDTNILILSGNAEDNFYVTQLFSKVFKQHNIYGINYLGFGESQGKPNEEEITQLIKDFVQNKKLNEQPLIIIGRSLGTGFATKINSEMSNVSKLILVSPYYSMESLAKHHTPFIPEFIIDKFMTNQIKTYQYAQKIKNPVYVFYTETDSIIPFKNTENLIDLFSNKKSFKIDNTDHGSIIYNQKTLRLFQEIILD